MKIYIAFLTLITLNAFVKATTVHFTTAELYAHSGRDKNAKVNGEVFEVTYPAKSLNPSGNNPGGCQFPIDPPTIFPAEEATLSYQVKFSDNFDWVRGKICLSGQLANDKM